MKIFTTIKVGYTAGICGCTGEYFNTIIVTDRGIENILYYGMFGADERINALLKEQGFEQKYVRSDFGQMKKKDICKRMFLSEGQAIEELKQRAR